MLTKELSEALVELHRVHDLVLDGHPLGKAVTLQALQHAKELIARSAGLAP